MPDVLPAQLPTATPSAEILSRLDPCPVKESHGKQYRRSPGGSGWICALCFPTDEPPDWQITPYVRPKDGPATTPAVANPREERGEIPASSAA